MSTTELLQHKKQNINKLNEIRTAQNDFYSTREARIECVVQVLAESIERVKISLILPKLLEDQTTLIDTLTGSIYEPVLHLVDDFMRRRHIIVKEQRPPLMDHGMIKIIDFFQVNYGIIKLFPQYVKEITNDEKKMLKAFEMLHQIAKEHLYRTSKTEISKERKLHQMYHENEDVRNTVDELRAKLHAQTISMRWKMAAKEVYLQKFEDDLAYKKWQNNVRIQNEIETCSRAIKATHKASQEKQKELEEELDKARTEYEKVTKVNLNQERDARSEKNKLLLQLQGLLKKYDNTIGDKMRENLDLQSEYNEAKRKLDDFMVHYRKVERVYNEIVVKREEEERRQQQRRIVLFMMNRAARKIQKYWKKWRKDQRKKNKRLKKGKKK